MIQRLLATISISELAMRCCKSNLSLYSLYFAEACSKFAGPISASLLPGNTASFEEMSQQWRPVGNSVSDLTGPRFEPQTSRSKNERITVRPTVSLERYFTRVFKWGQVIYPLWWPRLTKTYKQNPKKVVLRWYG